MPAIPVLHRDDLHFIKIGAARMCRSARFQDYHKKANKLPAGAGLFLLGQPYLDSVLCGFEGFFQSKVR